MNKKESLIERVGYLLDSANRRGTSQGVKIYEIALQQLQAAGSEDAVDEILDRLNKALIGIEAHGSFTNDEYAVVREIGMLQGRV